jgi:hypothetical protein
LENVMTVSHLSRPAEQAPQRPPAARSDSDGLRHDVIKLPDAAEPSPLHAEFAGRFSTERIEHTLAVARHVLERSQGMVTVAAVEALARESLLLRGPSAQL